MRKLIPLALVLLLAACGAEESAPQPRPAKERTAGVFPPRPQFTDRFADPGSGWPAGGYRAGGYTVRGAVPAPQRVTPGRRGTLAEVRVRPPRGGGSAGLFCRGTRDASRGYALLVDAGGRVAVLRIDGRRTRALKHFRLAPNERSNPALLRLGCGEGAGDQPVTLAFTVNASPYGYVYDKPPLPAGATSHAGLLADGRARFDDYALWLAE
jgi:hypothetical protein